MPSDLNQEVELKLDLDASDLDRLRSHPVLAGAGPGTTAQLETTYFDTPKHRLRRAGLSLRVRSDAGGHVQTVKAGAEGAAGLFDRPEWQAAVAGPAPEAEALRDTPVWDLLGGARVRRGFEALFTVTVERTTWPIERAGATIEVTLDRGEVRAGTATEPVAELELELKAGEPEALFALGREIADAVPLRLGVRAKAERGYMLLDRARLDAQDAGRPLTARAEAVALPRRVDAARGFHLIVQACLRHLWLNVGPLLATHDPEALHQARVAMRRLRSALRLFRPMVADEAYGDLSDALRAVSRQLGEARNLDVFLAGHAGTATGLATGLQPEPGTALAERAEVARQEAYERVLASLRDPAFARLTLDLLAWSLVGAWTRSDEPEAQRLREAPLQRVAAGILDAQARKVRRRTRGLAGLPAGQRHRGRVAAKALRYASEFFAGLDTGGKAQRRHGTYVAALERLQDSLGVLNDIEVGRALVASLGGAGEPETPVEDSLLAEAERAHDAFSRARPFWK